MRAMVRTTSLFALSLALCLAGCGSVPRTVPIPAPADVWVIPGLSLQAVEVAVMCGINRVDVPTSYDPRKELPQEEFDAMLKREFIDPAQPGDWYPEKREGSIRYASVDTRGHHLLVAIHLATDMLHIEFVESANLLQKNGMIHSKVLTWINNLAAHISRGIQQMAAHKKALETAPPAA
jgi:hypothetical protein